VESGRDRNKEHTSLEEVNLSLFSDDMILCIEKSQSIPKSIRINDSANLQD
jgi:hypothetical protein